MIISVEFGPKQPELEELTEKLGLAKYVEFTGFITGPAFQKTMKDMATVLIPSVWEDSAGLAASQQMMGGRLVIASDFGWRGEAVDGCGLRFPAGSTEALAQCENSSGPSRGYCAEWRCRTTPGSRSFLTATNG